MQFPLSKLSLKARRVLFVVSLASLLIFGTIMSRVQASPATDLLRVSQKELEFSKSPAEADKLISKWGDAGTERLRKQIWWDFGFLLSYAPLLSLGCTFGANGAFRHSRRMRTAGLLLAWGGLVAAGADVGANAAMLKMLQPPPAPVSPSVLLAARSFAWVQFPLFILAALYLLSAALISLLEEPRPADG